MAGTHLMKTQVLMAAKTHDTHMIIINPILIFAEVIFFLPRKIARSIKGM